MLCVVFLLKCDFPPQTGNENLAVPDFAETLPVDLMNAAVPDSAPVASPSPDHSPNAKRQKFQGATRNPPAPAGSSTDEMDKKKKNDADMVSTGAAKEKGKKPHDKEDNEFTSSDQEVPRVLVWFAWPCTLFQPSIGEKLHILKGRSSNMLYINLYT